MGFDCRHNIMFWGRFFFLICEVGHIGKPSVRTLTDPFSPLLSQYWGMAKRTFCIWKNKLGATFESTFAAVCTTKMMLRPVFLSQSWDDMDVKPYCSLIRHHHATNSPMRVSYGLVLACFQQANRKLRMNGTSHAITFVARTLCE